MDKFDKEKPKISLVPSELIIGVAEAMQYGANKYSRNNWKGGCNWTRLYDATQRHLMAWNDKDTFDDESKLNHLKHAAANIAFLLYYTAHNIGEDDR